MFKWFKRQEAAPAPQGKKPKSLAALRPVHSGFDPAAETPAPAALPEVVGEGNTQADWSMWEDSMTALDSQLHDIAPSSRIQVRETRPSQLDELDPFSAERRKRR